MWHKCVKILNRVELAILKCSVTKNLQIYVSMEKYCHLLLPSSNWDDFGITAEFFFVLISVKYERIKFLVIALKSSVEVYAWAPKPYHKFMAFKVTVYFSHI